MKRVEGYLVLIVGAPGCGKTRLAARMLRELPRDEGAVAYDREGDVATYLSDLLATGRVVLGDAMSSHDEVIRAVHGIKYPDGSWKTPPRVVILRGISRRYLFLQTASRIRDATVYADEAEDLFAQSVIEHEEQQSIIRVVRNRNNEVILSAQSPQDVATKVRSSAAWVIAFRQNLAHNVKALGACADEELWEPTRSLPPFRAVVKRPWRESAHEPLLPYDSVNDPIITRMDKETLDRYLAGPPDEDSGE